MSIARIVCSPSDLEASGFNFETEDTSRFDATRVSGAFHIVDSLAFDVGFDEPVGDVMWFHFRQSRIDKYFLDSHTFVVYDDNANKIFELDHSGDSNSTEHLSIYGDTTYNSGSRVIGIGVHYSYDFKLDMSGTDIEVSQYVNGALVATGTVANTAGSPVKGKPVSAVWINDDTHTFNGHDNSIYISEIIISEEDTRGMRIRELRPTSFGIHQEWDGLVEGMRDEDLTTGITTDTADRRTSFGVSNLEYVTGSDVINRIVVQSYAQRGESGITSMNHYFRYGDGNVEDGADIIPYSKTGSRPLV